MIVPKFLHVSDLHVGANPYGSKTLGQDFYSNFGWVIDVAQDHEFVIDSGDLFHRRWFRDATPITNVAKELQRLNKPYFIIKGNHDAARTASESDIINLLDSLGFVSLVEFTQTATADIYGVSWVASGLEEKIRDFSPNPDKYNILMVHGGVSKILPYNDPVNLDASFYKGLSFDYVALAHVHVPLDDGVIHIPGALTPLDANDAKKPGAVISVHGSTVSRLYPPTRRKYWFITIPGPVHSGIKPTDVVIATITDINADIPNLGLVTKTIVKDDSISKKFEALANVTKRELLAKAMQTVGLSEEDSRVLHLAITGTTEDVIQAL